MLTRTLSVVADPDSGRYFGMYNVNPFRGLQHEKNFQEQLSLNSSSRANYCRGLRPPTGFIYHPDDNYSPCSSSHPLYRTTHP